MPLPLTLNLYLSLENGFIVRDDIETGHGIVVPLWHFGLPY